MKIKYSDLAAIVVLFIAAFWLWTLPIQASPVPFGEGDAAWQFTSGDQMYLADRADFSIPTYLGMWYYNYNKILGPDVNEYPPPYPLNIALAQIFSGDRFAGAYIMIALLSFLGVFSAFLLARKLYGLLPGIAAGFGMLFVTRNIMAYLWGQRGSVISFNFIPIALYTYYEFINSEDRKKKIAYLFSFAAVLASQYYFHMQGAAVSVFVVVLYTIALSVKRKAFPVSLKEYWKPILAAVFALLVLTMPFILIYLGPDETHEIKFQNPGRLLSWFKIDDQEGYPVNVLGYPTVYFFFSSNYHFYLLPFLFIGIIFLLLNRRDRDLLLLSWLVGVYLLIHLDVIGYFHVGRAARMLLSESALFYTIISVGLFSVVSFFKVKKEFAAYAKYALLGFFIILLLFTNAKNSYTTLKGAYQPSVLRLNDAQISAAAWMKANLPEDAIVIAKGTLTYPKLRFMIPYSERHITNQAINWSEQRGIPLDLFYYLVDYSDYALLGRADQANALFEWEKANFANSTLIFNQNNIHIWHGNIKVFTNA